MKPLIGLTPTPEIKKQEHGTFRLHTLNQHYSRAVIAAGGIPVVLPSNIEDVAELLNRLDAVIITGGGDIDPELYEQDQHETTDEIDPERDTFEQKIVHEAVERDMPLLGICRGLQMLNVALGGTLTQDIDDLVEGASEHRQQKLKVHHEAVFQTAQLSDGNHPLRAMTGANQIEINSFHHQSINQLADSLQVMATTDDNIVEAVYNPQMTFCMAVQWHPELLQHKHPEHAAIFESLIESARTYQSRMSNREVPELV